MLAHVFDTQICIKLTEVCTSLLKHVSLLSSKLWSILCRTFIPENEDACSSGNINI